MWKFIIKVMLPDCKHSSLFVDIAIDLNSKSSQNQRAVCFWFDFPSCHSRETPEGKYHRCVLLSASCTAGLQLGSWGQRDQRDLPELYVWSSGFSTALKLFFIYLIVYNNEWRPWLHLSGNAYLYVVASLTWRLLSFRLLIFLVSHILVEVCLQFCSMCTAKHTLYWDVSWQFLERQAQMSDTGIQSDLC